MLEQIRTLGKKLLSKLIPDSNRLLFLFYLPKLEAFRKAHPENYPVFADKDALHGYINETVLQNGAIAYWEFGVWKGFSMQKWAALNTHRDSLFYGFDTFTGLPETWQTFTGSIGRNIFDTQGATPEVDDKRVSFVKGMFQHTLPEFLAQYAADRQLIIHNDSDLYSSTLYVLTAAHEHIVPGTIIIFDEFSSVLNEFRALEDYCSSYLRSYNVIAATVSANGYYSQVAIRMT